MPLRRRGERLSAADASNVVMDSRDQVNVFLMAGLLGAGGFVSPDGALDLVQVRSSIADRLAGGVDSGLARFSERVQGEGRALSWERCEPDLTWHVRVSGPVDGLPGLAALCGALMTTPLPVDRPLWELLIVPGAAVGRPGMILRVHHAVADGVAGVRLVQRLFGSADDLPEEKPATPRTEAARPRWTTTLAGSVSRLTALFRTSVPPTVLLGPIGPQRGVAFAEVDLGMLAAGARTVGA
ncbi:MAG: wax ester/triacylglycerol synthase domain-containing protein, partial [Micropruina sp.]